MLLREETNGCIALHSETLRKHGGLVSPSIAGQPDPHTCIAYAMQGYPSNTPSFAGAGCPSVARDYQLGVTKLCWGYYKILTIESNQKSKALKFQRKYVFSNFLSLWYLLASRIYGLVFLVNLSSAEVNYKNLPESLAHLDAKDFLVPYRFLKLEGTRDLSRSDLNSILIKFIKLIISIKINYKIFKINFCLPSIAKLCKVFFLGFPNFAMKTALATLGLPSVARGRFCPNFVWAVTAPALLGATALHSRAMQGKNEDILNSLNISLFTFLFEWGKKQHKNNQNYWIFNKYWLFFQPLAYFSLKKFFSKEIKKLISKKYTRKIYLFNNKFIKKELIIYKINAVNLSVKIKIVICQKKLKKNVIRIISIIYILRINFENKFKLFKRSNPQHSFAMQIYLNFAFAPFAPQLSCGAKGFKVNQVARVVNPSSAGVNLPSIALAPSSLTPARLGLESWVHLPKPSPGKAGLNLGKQKLCRVTLVTLELPNFVWATLAQLELRVAPQHSSAMQVYPSRAGVYYPSIALHSETLCKHGGLLSPSIAGQPDPHTCIAYAMQDYPGNTPSKAGVGCPSVARANQPGVSKLGRLILAELKFPNFLWVVYLNKVKINLHSVCPNQAPASRGLIWANEPSSSNPSVAGVIELGAKAMLAKKLGLHTRAMLRGEVAKVGGERGIKVWVDKAKVAQTLLGNFSYARITQHSEAMLVFFKQSFFFAPSFAGGSFCIALLCKKTTFENEPPALLGAKKKLELRRGNWETIKLQPPLVFLASLSLWYLLASRIYGGPESLAHLNAKDFLAPHRFVKLEGTRDLGKRLVASCTALHSETLCKHGGLVSPSIAGQPDPHTCIAYAKQGYPSNIPSFAGAGCPSVARAYQPGVTKLCKEKSFSNLNSQEINIVEFFFIKKFVRLINFKLLIISDIKGQSRNRYMINLNKKFRYKIFFPYEKITQSFLYNFSKLKTLELNIIKINSITFLEKKQILIREKSLRNLFYLKELKHFNKTKIEFLVPIEKKKFKILFSKIHSNLFSNLETISIKVNDLKHKINKNFIYKKNILKTWYLEKYKKKIFILKINSNIEYLVFNLYLTKQLESSPSIAKLCKVTPALLGSGCPSMLGLTKPQLSPLAELGERGLVAQPCIAYAMQAWGPKVLHSSAMQNLQPPYLHSVSLCKVTPAISFPSFSPQLSNPATLGLEELGAICPSYAGSNARKTQTLGLQSCAKKNKKIITSYLNLRKVSKIIKIKFIKKNTQYSLKNFYKKILNQNFNYLNYRKIILYLLNNSFYFKETFKVSITSYKQSFFLSSFLEKI